MLGGLFDKVLKPMEAEVTNAPTAPKRSPEEDADDYTRLKALADSKGPGWSVVRGNDGQWVARLTDPMAQSTFDNDPRRQAPAPSAATTAPNIPGASAQPAAAVPTTRGQAFGAAPAMPAPAPSAVRAPPGAGAPMAGFQNTATPAAFSVPAAPASGFTPATVDYSRYDQAASGYDRAVSTFQSELDRLSGVDPFGNQAFLRQATDRATAQAGGLAAGGLSTATARAGNMRQAQGVQAQMSAQGRDQATIQRAQDENQAAGLRLNAAGGLANTLGAKASNEVELAKLQTSTMQSNMQGMLDKYKFDKQLSQQDVENLRQAAVAYGQIDQQRYATDAQYAAEMDNQVLGKYVSDNQLKGAMAQISASEKLTTKDLVMGGLGAVAGLGGAAIMKSDRRAKFDVRDPDLRDLEDFLGRTKGKLYRYKQPAATGQRAGLHYGPMAQDLQRSKIGRTVVVDRGEDGLYVDTGRLALADHAALAALAAEVKALKSGK